MTAEPSQRVQRLRSRTVGLELASRRVGLPAWFIAVDLLWIAKPDVLGVDARHYQRAAIAWLEGGDPWTITEFGIPFAAGPHTLPFYAATSWLPLGVATALWTVLGIGAALWLVRLLRLPFWWALFPPLAHAAWNGNPQTFVVALLVVGSSMAGALAAALKLYALLPLLFHPRRLAVAGAVLAVTLPLLPWSDYVNHGFGAGAMIATGWNGSAWRLPILVPPTVVALWLLRERGGEWYIVPALVPGAQFYYVSTALPAIAGRPVLAAALATPIAMLVPVVVLIEAARLVIRRGWLRDQRIPAGGGAAISTEP